MNEEIVYLDDGGVKVTSARFVTPGETFAMSGVTSVKLRESPPPYKNPAILGVLGLLFLFSGDAAAIVFGIVFVAAAIFWGMQLKTKYIVILKSSSGENEAISSEKGDYIKNIEKALNDSIIGRG